MKINNLEAKANEIKNTYLPKLIKNTTESEQRIKRIMLESDRAIGRNNYSDEEIDKMVDEVSLSEECSQEIEEKFKIENMVNHSSMTWFGFDIMYVCENMKYLDNEETRYLVFDSNHNYLGCCSSSSNEKTGVSGGGMYELNKKLITEFPNAKLVINIHNHPHEVACIPSKGDCRTWWRTKNALDEFGIRLEDVCIISELDFYSRRCDEQNCDGKEDKIFEVHPFTAETMKMISKENIYIAWNLDHRFNDKDFKKTLYYEELKKAAD